MKTPLPATEPDGWFARLARHHLDRSPLNQSFRRLRGKPTTWQEMLSNADLPPAIDGAVQRIARKTRVMPFERATFVAELIGHCQDGLDAGTDPEDLARGLGPPPKVGKLAGRALRRKRPAVVRPIFAFVAGVRRGVVAVVSIYLLLAVWFFARSPEITVDHVAELNAPFVGTPERDRAFGLVGDVAKGIKEIKDARAREMGYGSYQDIMRGDENEWLFNWPDGSDESNESLELALLDEAHDIVAVAREAAARPRLGWTWSLGDAYDDDPLEETMVSILLPYVGDYRQAARLLMLDARAAALEGDSERLTRDLVAIAGLAQDLNDDGAFLIELLVSWAILAQSIQETNRLLAASPDLLDDDQLARIDAALDFPISTMGEFEHRVYHDVVQRAYAPGPRGRLTRQGLGITASGHTGQPQPSSIERTLLMLGGPVIATVFVTRGETLAFHEGLFDAYDAAAQRVVVAEADWQGISDLYEEGISFRDPIASLLLPALGKSLNSLQQIRTRRDAARLTIAAHRFRRVNGAFPADACELVPSYLDRIPPDRFTGEAMTYRAEQGVPIVYVTGPDADDDGGVPPVRRPRNQAATIDRFNASRSVVPDGDWVLFPEPASDDEDS